MSKKITKQAIRHAINEIPNIWPGVGYSSVVLRRQAEKSWLAGYAAAKAARRAKPARKGKKAK